MFRRIIIVFIIFLAMFVAAFVIGLSWQQKKGKAALSNKQPLQKIDIGYTEKSNDGSVAIIVARLKELITKNKNVEANFIVGGTAENPIIQKMLLITSSESDNFYLNFQSNNKLYPDSVNSYALILKKNEIVEKLAKYKDRDVKLVMVLKLDKAISIDTTETLSRHAACNELFYQSLNKHSGVSNCIPYVNQIYVILK